MTTSYQEQALTGATGMELVIALYDGVVRFLYRAIQCVEEDDVRGRRIAVKKAVDIIMYLQAKLRYDLGGTASDSLSDFYAEMFTMTLEASSIASKEHFEEVIACFRNVRDAWSIVAKNPEAGRVLPRELRTREERFVTGSVVAAASADGEVVASRWLA